VVPGDHHILELLRYQHEEHIHKAKHNKLSCMPVFRVLTAADSCNISAQDKVSEAEGEATSRFSINQHFKFFGVLAAKVAKMRLFVSPCLSECNGSRIAEWIFMKFDVGSFVTFVDTL
jgi:hypothetical protein